MTPPRTRPDIREDPLTGRWVIIEPDRKRRPGARPASPPTAGESAGCLFCPGHEPETVEEVFALRPENSRPDTPGWRVRVFPNKYPILAGPLVPHTNAVYRHELIVETPDHVRSLTEIPLSHMGEILQVYRDRIRQAVQADPGCIPVLFKNVGPLSGASQAHSHAQLLSLPRIPRLLEEETQAVRRNTEREGVCWYCRLLERETTAGVRIVAAGAAGCVLAPEYSRFPWEMLLLPTVHAPAFDRADDILMEEIGRLLYHALCALEHVTGGCDYNVYLRTAPGKADDWPMYHWHLGVTPRLAGIAAFELSTGVFVNTVAPEDAARTLREAILLNRQGRNSTI